MRGVRTAWPEAHVDVVVNTADDVTMHGLRICPDIDTMIYALGDAIDPDRGWGLADEGWRIMAELKAHGVEPTWFALGDRDIATHLIRTQMLQAGFGLADVTAALSKRWLGEQHAVTLWPMTEDRVETHIVIDGEDGPRAIHFQEFWVRHHAEPAVRQVTQVGIEKATPTGGLDDVFAAADLVLLAPSNPVVSIGPILGVPGMRELLLSCSAPIAGFSGILGGAPVLGMADKLLPAIGVEVDAAAVGLHYGPRDRDGLLDAWIMHTSDRHSLPRLDEAGMRAEAVDLLMTSPDHTAHFVKAGAELAGWRG